MNARRTPVLNRSDTLLGVCEAIGQDFGINPLIPRIGFALMLFWSLKAAFALYALLGLAVLASRLLFPPRSRQAGVPAAAPARANDAAEMEFAQAA